MNAEPGILLDVSRLVSRLGKGALTGIDRVEVEWLRHLQGRSHLLLCRVRGGQLVLPPTTGEALLTWIENGTADLPRPGLIDRLRGCDTPRTRVIHALRGMAVLRLSRRVPGLGGKITERLGQGAIYMNLGHANFDRRVFGALPPLRRVVLIHDTIPLDHPEFARAGHAEVFRARFMIAVGMADLILTVSNASAASVENWRRRLAVSGRAPVVATPIGTRLAVADDRSLPGDLDLARPFFVTVGTIEPRKNHAILLDAWEELAHRLPAAEMPQLFIVGRRGWENHETFRRLDALPGDGPVRELSGLDDHAVAALLQRSHALLMPSRAEGFGLPLTEAAGRGVPVLSAPLDAAKELLGSYPLWLDPDRAADWADAVQGIARKARTEHAPCAIVTWSQHFESVHRALMQK